MPLESLLQLVETLRGRIDTHRAALSQSEALTRYALIDPLLRELGWDTEDPSMVVPEYRVPNNQIADYVLFHGDRPAMVVESKKLDESLQGGRALDQGILYCAHTGASYFLLTDGNRWELYESGRTNPQTAFSLTDDSPAQTCLKALALWRPSVQAGVVTAGHEPVFTSLEEAGTSPQQTLPASADSTDNEDGWFPLLGLARELGSDRPREISFPDSSRVSIRYWVGVMEETVRWLTDRGLLTAADCPIQRGTRNLVATRPEHPRGQTPRFRRVNSLYFDRDYTGPALHGKGGWARKRDDLHGKCCLAGVLKGNTPGDIRRGGLVMGGRGCSQLRSRKNKWVNINYQLNTCGDFQLPTIPSAYGR